MDGQHGSGAPGRTAAATDGELDADAPARDQAAASVQAISGSTDGAQRRGVGGIDSDREGGRFRVRLFMPSWRRRTTRDVLAAGDAERERLAQDLHDGAQQHLTALRVRLTLEAERFDERGETEASAVLQGFGDDLDHLIDELRDLAQGIYPALLTSFGLAAALRSAGARSGGG
jgi:signal transduction histidine kinase